MKKITLLLLIASLLVINPSCVKDRGCSPNPVANEASEIMAYAMANGIDAVQHSSGLFYEIIDPGSGPRPTINSNVVITYRGELLNGEMFDELTTPNVDPWPLSRLIEGWIVGLPLISKGGHIKLIIPSALAYGCQGQGTIPGDTPLFFDVQLVDVQ